MDWLPMLLELEPTSSGLAIDCNPLRATFPLPLVGKGGAEGDRQDAGIELGEEPMDRRLTGDPLHGEAKLRQEIRGLACRPCSHRQDRGVGTPQSGRGQREHRREGMMTLAHAQNNQDRFKQASDALRGTGKMPKGTSVTSTRIQPNQAVTQGQSHEDLKEAMKTTAFAWGLYWLFARRAVSTGHPDLGVLFLDAASLEREDHFNRAANLYGLVGDDVANLQTSIRGETKAHQHYTNDTEQAQREENQQAAKFFNDAASDEENHKKDFEIFLQRLQSKS